MDATHMVFSMGYVVLSMLVGWCGNEPWPWWWWLIDVISVIGGLVGGFLVSQVFPSEVSFVTIAIGAFVGGRVISSLYNRFTMKNETQ
jgi:hypothetical protein